MNNDTIHHKQDSIPCKKPYEMPEIFVTLLEMNDVISTSTPDDRGDWDINIQQQPGGNR